MPGKSIFTRLQKLLSAAFALLALTIGLFAAFAVPASATSLIDNSKSTVVASNISGSADHFEITGSASMQAGIPNTSPLRPTMRKAM